MEYENDDVSIYILNGKCGNLLINIVSDAFSFQKATRTETAGKMISLF